MAKLSQGTLECRTLRKQLS